MSRKTRTRSEVTEDDNISEEDYEPKAKKRRVDLNGKVGTKSIKNNFKKSKMEADNHIDTESSLECVELPPEILVQIFGYLPRKDLKSAGKVSQHWALCSKDDSLFWLPIWKIILREDKGAYEYGTGWHKTAKYLKQSRARKSIRLYYDPMVY